jgi:hypothetical protein
LAAAASDYSVVLLLLQLLLLLLQLLLLLLLLLLPMANEQMSAAPRSPREEQPAGVQGRQELVRGRSTWSSPLPPAPIA